MTKKIGLLQANLNHCSRAQDLYLHTLAQWKCGIGIAAEPYRVPPDHPCWASNDTGSVAITWRRETDSPPCIRVGSGRAYTAVEWGPLWVVGCYIPPASILPCSGISSMRYHSSYRGDSPNPLWRRGLQCQIGALGFPANGP